MDLEIEDKKQWHPAFCAAVELEFREDNRILHYEREHNLSKKPLQMDLLVIKKDPNRTLRNEIGDFFLGHNIMEYKSPGDDLSVDDLFKVLGYACIYKAENGEQGGIPDSDITISLVREGAPLKLLDYLSKKYTITKKSSGIYRITGLLFPLQILVTGKLDPASHMWVCSLTRSMKQESAETLLSNYSSLKNTRDKKNAGVIVDFVSNVNGNLFLQILKGSEHMTEEMKALIEPEIIELRLTIKNQAAELANSKKELASNKKELASNRKKLADKDAEIERLKQQLEEFMKKHTSL